MPSDPQAVLSPRVLARERSHDEQDGSVRRFWRCMPVADALQAEAEAARALAESEKRLSVAYAERNLVAQLAAHFADELDLPVWWGVDPAEPDWPVLYIEGPTGQLSWHMPKPEAIGRYSDPGSRLVEKRWDGHTTEEKDDRIRAALLEGEPDAR